MALRSAELAGAGRAVAGRLAPGEAGDGGPEGTLPVALGGEPEVPGEAVEAVRV
jgi:hypothetical protein